MSRPRPQLLMDIQNCYHRRLRRELQLKAGIFAGNSRPRLSEMVDRIPELVGETAGGRP
jgi:hypothetical protein